MVAPVPPDPAPDPAPDPPDPPDPAPDAPDPAPDPPDPVPVPVPPDPPAPLILILILLRLGIKVEFDKKFDMCITKRKGIHGNSLKKTLQMLANDSNTLRKSQHSKDDLVRTFS